MKSMNSDKNELTLHKSKDEKQTKASWSHIARIIELADSGYQYRGISVKLKKEGVFFDRRTIKKILLINDRDEE